WVQAVSDRDHAGRQVVDVAQLADLWLHAAPALDAVNAARFYQQPVTDRRAPVKSDEALQRESAIVARLWRHDGAARLWPDARGARAEVLLVEGHAELVLRVGLIREAGLEDRLLLVEHGLRARWHVVVAIDIVGILVEEQAGDVVV